MRLRVVHTDTDYTIHYLDSHNMNYAQSGTEVRIHPNYNRWVRNLEQRIASFGLM